jgi:RHS repeat-associated protein
MPLVTTRSARSWFSLAVLVISCRSSHDQPGGDGKLGTRTGSLAASTTLSQALVGHVQQVPNVVANGFIAAAVTGDLAVEDNGSAAYRVPLWVPEGVHGMQPSLALEYNSQGGRSFLGPKWRLAGLSAITRCRQDLATDAVRRPVDFVNGDTFCLDGERLIRTSGSPKDYGDFRTEKNPFRRIRVTAVGIPNQILNFEVWEPDGRILSYGRNPGARLDVNAPDGNVHYYAYYLDKVQDRYGNSMFINYRKDYTYAAGSGKVQELFPATITWGATGDFVGQRTVNFVYQPPNGYHPDEEGRFISGYEIVAGERLTALEMSGPDGLGGTPLVKRYKFTYNRPAAVNGQAHGLQRLTTITECDGNSVCKRPTAISWDDGSNTYVRQDLGSLSVGLLNTSGYNSNAYRRLLVKDLNNDGLDDIIYRAYVPDASSPTGQRLGWVAQPNTTTGSTVSFGNSAVVPGAQLIDSRPGLFNPYGNDPIFADVDGDDYPDVILARGGGGRTIESPGDEGELPFALDNITGSYFLARQLCSVPGGLQSGCGFLGGFTGLGSIDDPTITSTDNPAFSLGDMTGDGYPEFIRPRDIGLGASGFHWNTLLNNQSGDFTWGDHFEVMDLDGDGNAEVLVPGQLVAQSPTLANQSTNFPLNINGYGNRWLLDLNGDGLTDLAFQDPNNPSTITTQLNLGSGQFGPAVVTSLSDPYRVGQAWRFRLENGVRVVDYDSDGFEDLLLVDNGAQDAPIGPTRTNAVVLLSDGNGGFIPTSTSVPIGDYADGQEFGGETCAQYAAANGGIPPCRIPEVHGYRTTEVADVNGDGLPDVLQLENAFLVAYIRQGNKPGVVKSITEGTGHRFDISYAPVSDSTVYTKDPMVCAGSNSLSCLNRARTVVRSTTESGYLLQGISATQTTSYKYTGGVYDRFGRGFLGFERRDISGPGSRHVTMTYNPIKVVQLAGAGSPYIYPWAMTPLTVTTDVDTPQGPQAHHRRVETFSYSDDVVTSLSRWMVLPTGSSLVDYDCPADGAGGCAGPLRSLGGKDEYFTYDPTLTYNPLGVPQTHTIAYREPDTDSLQTDTQVNTFGFGFDPTTWLMPITQIQITSNSPTETVTRTFRYGFDRQVNAITGLPSGDTTTIMLEPAGLAAVRRVRTLTRDTRGRLALQKDQAILAGGLYPPRTTTYRYDDADGVYVSSVTNQLQQMTRIWRHPALGLIVEMDDPNNLAAVGTYDTFGRVLSVTERSGASATYSYADGSAPGAVGGVNMSVFPEGKTTRQINVHLDSFGREAAVTTPVDGSRIVTLQTLYDGVGRLSQKIVKTGTTATGTPTVANSFTYTYDDLNRLISDCHIGGDGLNHCTAKQYDGLTTTTTDDSGRVVTEIADAMNRLSIQRVTLQTGASDATFTYGPFGLLRHEGSSDGSGQTDIAYDVLGRQISLTRTGAGTWLTAYNAFNDAITTSKQTPSGAVAEQLSYTYDGIARPTQITSGTNFLRGFVWDTAPNGVGKLAQTTDSSGSRVSYQYGANGLKSMETWEASLFGSPLKTVGQNAYLYDPQGRTEWIYYPQNLPGSYAGLGVKYVYDQYNGDVASVADAVNLSNPLWSASSRNELGEVTSETMNTYAANTTVTKATTYYSHNGRMHTATLTGNNGSFSLTHDYQADQLLNSQSVSGVGGSWNSMYNYDNLKRLTLWRSQCCGGLENVDVNYIYDSDGNLTNRSWSSSQGGEGSIYSNVQAADGSWTRTIQTGGSHTTPYTDTYLADTWGRVFDTPSVGLTYNAADEVTAVTEKTNGGRIDTIVRDALGRRITTSYGTNPSGSYLLTLMNNLYEFHYASETQTYEERCRLQVGNKVVGDVVRTAATAFKTATFYLSDNVGSVMAESSDSGAIAARARRDPFGGLTGTAGNSPDLAREPSGSDPDGTGRFGFAGHSRDLNWGLIDMKGRFYSPRLARFIAADPFVTNPGDRRDYNPFAYVRNTPTTLTDPTGHNPNGCGDAQCGASPSVPTDYSEAARDPNQQQQDEGKDGGGPKATSINGEIIDQDSNEKIVVNTKSGPKTAPGIKLIANGFRGQMCVTPGPSPVLEPNPRQPTVPTTIESHKEGGEAAKQADAMNGNSGPPPGAGEHAGEGKIPETVATLTTTAGELGLANGMHMVGDTLEHTGHLYKNAATTADEVKYAEKMIGAGEKTNIGGGITSVVTGGIEFAYGYANGDAEAKTNGALSIGAGLVAIAIGGPAAWVIGGGVLIFQLLSHN